MDVMDYMRFVLAFAFVLALMGGLAVFMRRVDMRRFIPGTPEKRLNVLELRQIDSRHRLAIVECDSTQHLLVLGPDSQTLLQTIPKQDNPA